MIEQAQVGALQIARISVGPMGPIVDELNVFNMPFVFKDEAHMRKVIDGPIGQEMLGKLTNSSARLVALGWMDAGTRNVYSDKPVTKPADLKGMKIRMMGNPLFVETMKLPKADQDLIRKLSREAQLEQRKLWDAYVAEATSKLKAAGVRFVPADKEAFFKATQPVRDKYGAKYASLIQRIRDTK
jgi:TRAP-type C4-dicarboxylate transport system substrate-binding protein